MPTDYKPRNDLKQEKNLPGYIWLLSGLAIGLFIALIIYIDKQPATPVSFNDAVKSEIEQRKVSTTTNSKPKPVPEAVEPKYNFYTILQGMKVLIPESETRPPETNNKNSAEEISINKRYFLQAGSFQNLADAEKLKVKIAFLGIEAEVQHVTVNNQKWHRVRTNPFENKKQLYQNMKTLQRNNINAISMELK